MPEIILSINAGSSSVKISVYKSPDTYSSTSTKPPTNPFPSSSSSSSTTTKTVINPPIQLAEVSIEGLTAPPASLKYERGDKKIKGQEVPDIKTQEDAFNYILEYLTKDEGLPELGKKEDIKWTCHRVVHGGDYPKSQVIDEKIFHHIRKMSDLAPLHNAPALGIVRATDKLLPHATNIAYFDSSFHSTLPRHISTYPIDPTTAEKNNLRKYGFHGISYHFIVKAVSAYLQKPEEKLNIIALHLGSGASMCCIKNGASHDTTMGLTPLEGLPGATRSGSIDPSLMFHFTHSAGNPSHESTSELHITEAEEILNKKSGWKALTGTTDFGKISGSDRDEDVLAFDIFVDRITNYLAPYFTKLDARVDALVFAGGIGERGSKLRAAVVEGVRCLGFALDEGKNAKPEDGVVVDISKEGARFKTLICKTDEQLQMARGVLEERERLERKKKAA